MPTHSKQHFIPKVYLTAWCDPRTPKGQDPYLWIHPAGDGDPKRKAPKRVFTETDMYTIQGPGGRDLRLEHGLSTLESTFARIRRTILEPRKPLGSVDRIWLAAFVAAMQARTQTQRDHLKSEFGRLAKWAEDMGAQMRRMTPEQRRVLSAVPGDRSRSMSFDDLQRLAGNPLETFLPMTIAVWTPVLAQLTLTVLCTRDSTSFITSDAPVALLHPDADAGRHPLLRPGLLAETAELTLPVSPTRALLFSHRPGPLYSYADIRGAAVVEVNQRTLAYARDSYIANTATRDPRLHFPKREQKPGQD